MTTNIFLPDSGLACNLTTPDEVAQQQSAFDSIVAGADQIADLERGFGFGFADAERWASAITAFVMVERRCCSFFHFELIFEPPHALLWFRISGPEGVKEVLRAGCPALAHFAAKP